MAQSTNRPSSGGGRKRTPPPAVKKPFPWGTVVVSAVLGVLLIGIIVYAVQNQGAGFVTALTRADQQVEDVKVSKDLKRDHVGTPVDYGKTPPVGGAHNGGAQQCAVYSEPIASELAVHSLEHGAVWITYRPDLDKGEVAKLAALAQGNPYRLMSPFPGLDAPISLQAWGRRITADKASEKKVEDFLDAYTSGPQAPERGAACSGTTATGPLTTQPAPSPMMSAGASPSS